MRLLMPLLFAVLGACTTQGMAPPRHTARFPTFPSAFFSALQASCVAPTQDFARPSRLVAECREYLAPQPTASAILLYDGTPRDLPRLVIRFSARPDGAGYLVETEAFLNVPQKSGPALHVLFPSSRYDRTLASMYRLAGGVPA